MNKFKISQLLENTMMCLDVLTMLKLQLRLGVDLCDPVDSSRSSPSLGFIWAKHCNGLPFRW